jgi:preprotein translocase subunit SecG
MKTTTNTSVVIAFAVVTVVLLLFGGGAMAAGMMHGGAHENGWMVVRGWMWTPALLTLGLGVVLGQFIFRKKG